MSTISYKCDTCKREVELLENSRGLTVFSKCVITEGCKGKLYVTARNPDGYREVFPSDVPDLEEYTSRRAFVEFKQDILSKVWKIKHDMSVFPAVTVYFTINGVTSEVSADDYTINLLTNNTLEVQFDLPSKGVVHLVARSSVPLSPETVSVTEDLVQVSKGGTLTFAFQKLIDTGQPNLTDMKTVDSSLEICLQAPKQEPITCTEVIEYGLEFGSPWISWDEILVRNRKQYYPRSKNVLDFSVYQGTIYDITDIEDGTSLSFKRVQYDNSNGTLELIEPRKIFLLLSTYPHESVDKVLNKLIDISELGSENPNYLTFKDGELFADLSAIEVVYPNISKYAVIEASPTPTPSVTPSVSKSATPTPTPSVSKSATPTPTPTQSQAVLPAPNVFTANDSLRAAVNDGTGTVVLQTLIDGDLTDNRTQALISNGRELVSVGDLNHVEVIDLFTYNGSTIEYNITYSDSTMYRVLGATYNKTVANDGKFYIAHLENSANFYPQITAYTYDVDAGSITKGISTPILTNVGTQQSISYGDVAHSADSQYLFFVGNNTLAAFDVDTLVQVAAFALPSTSSTIAYDGTYIYIQYSISPALLEAYTFDGTSFTLVGYTTYPQGSYVQLGLYVHGGYIYSDLNTNYLTVYTFNGSMFTEIDTIYSPSFGSAIQYYNGAIYTNKYGTKIFAFDGTTLTNIPQAPTGDGVFNEAFYVGELQIHTPSVTPTPTPTPTSSPTPTPTPTPSALPILPISACSANIPPNVLQNEVFEASCLSLYRNGSYAKYFTFTLAQQTSVIIDLESSTVDTFVILYDGIIYNNGNTGTVVATDDDGGTGTNSKIATTLNAGDYTIEATTYNANSAGNFTITLTI